MNMKNSDVQSKAKDSPKTPGGISKSHLTSIRRLGLSRKWKKSGISPFISPLASNSNTVDNKVIPVDNAAKDTKARKRKLRLDDEDTEFLPGDDEKNHNSEIAASPPASEEVPRTDDSTPIRKSFMTPKRSKAYNGEKTTIAGTKHSQEDQTLKKQSISDLDVSSYRYDLEEKRTSNECLPNNEGNSAQTPVIIPTGCAPIIEVEDTKLNKISCINDNVTEGNPELPNKLIKECIVVIQNKILKKKKGNKTLDLKPEVLCDSDTDDIPLSHINKMKVTIQNDNSDSDFKRTENKHSPKVQPIKNKSMSSKKSVCKKQKEKDLNDNKESNKSSQSSNSFNDEDEDDDFEINKKIILFPKSYEKLSKPLKAKSTGSITQKDIDDIKARIEMKKKLLLAKVQSKDTEELRGLIKKWRIGCQDALMELLELMKKKLPDRSDMNFANILQMLKIPPSYVGYDAENDCFATPDDNSILASIFSDL